MLTIPKDTWFTFRLNSHRTVALNRVNRKATALQRSRTAPHIVMALWPCLGEPNAFLGSQFDGGHKITQAAAKTFV